MMPHPAAPRLHTGRLHRYAGGVTHHRSTPRQPWTVVAAHDHGLLRYSRARGVVSLAVHYAVWGHRLILRLPAFNDASHFLDRADVALDVDASSAGRRQVVRVAGTALAVAGGTVPEEVGAVLETWPEGLPSSAVIIVPESVRWLPLVDDVRYPPLPDPWDRLPATYAE